MTSSISIANEQQRFDLAEALGAMKVERMSLAQLDLAAALVFVTAKEDAQVREDRLQAAAWQDLPLEYPLRVEQAPDYGHVEIFVADAWRPFSPTSNWDAYGLLMESTGVVQGTHETTDPKQPDRQVFWYSAHAYFSGTRTDGYDLRSVVAQTVAKLLEHQIRLQKFHLKTP